MITDPLEPTATRAIPQSLLSLLVGNSLPQLGIATLMGILGGTGSAIIIIHARSIMEGHGGNHPWLMFALICTLACAGRLGSNLFMARLSQRTIMNIRVRLVEQVLKCPLRQLEALGPGRIFALITEDVQIVANATEELPDLIINFLIVASCLAYLAYLSRYLFFILVGIIIATSIVHTLLRRKPQRLIAEGRDKSDDLFANVRDAIDGAVELKLNSARRADYLSTALNTSAATVRDIYIRALGWLDSSIAVSMFSAYGAIGIILFLATAPNVDSGLRTSYVLLIAFLVAPLQQIFMFTQLVTKATVALRKINTLQSTLTGESLSVRPTPNVKSGFVLEFVEVKHCYRAEQGDSAFNLGPINLTIGAGKLIFVIGGNGSGKSTFAKVLTGLYYPESGHLRLNGQNIEAADREPYRQLFSAVFTDFAVFKRLHGIDPVVMAEQIPLLLRQLRLENKIQIQNGTFSQTALSRGQRKRLALLTAVLEDRPIYVLDEWAADQDPYFKQLFYESILPDLKRKGKTVILITHDDRYFHLADELIKLESGKVVFHGPFKMLQ